MARSANWKGKWKGGGTVAAALPSATGIDARRAGCLGGHRIGQKKDKSGKGKATDQDRPVPHVEATNSTLRHRGDELDMI
jgi:hypothetical protein